MLIPKPDLRIERIAAKIDPMLDTLIIGNSILEHQSPCDESSKKLNKIIPGINIVGEGGLLIEEISLVVNKKNIKKIIVVLSSYNFYQPIYYPIQTSIYYKGIEESKLLASNYILRKQSLWRLDDYIQLGSTVIKRGQASQIIKEEYRHNRCGKIDWRENELLETIHRHTHNNFIDISSQINILNSLNKNYDLTVLIIPIWMQPDIFENSTYQEYKDAVDRIKSELNINGIKFKLIDVNKNIENYDEPWCMCGHLSAKGRIKLMQSILDVYQSGK